MASIINASTTSTSGLVYSADASGVLQLQGNGTTGLTVGNTGNVTVNTNLFVSGAEVEPLVLGTAQASTSGTNIDFTGIPNWVKRITVMFNGVSTNGTSNLQIQLGTSSGIETSGYAGTVFVSEATAVGSGNFSTGFLVDGTTLAADIRSGSATFVLFSTNIWVGTGTFGLTNKGRYSSFTGTKTTATTLDRIRVTTANGTDAFDAGSINIMYE